jgi:pseudouridine kinase
VDSQVIAIGGANIDIKAKARRELTPGTSNPGDVAFSAGGVARNVAHNLAGLGVTTGLITAVGHDVFGDRLIAETERAGVDCSLVLRSDEPTGAYVALLRDTGEMEFAVNAMPAMERLVPKFLEKHEERLRAAKFVFADCNLPAASLSWLYRFERKLILDAVSAEKADKLRLLFGRSIFALTLNQGQAQRLSGEADPERGARFFVERGFERVVVTIGHAGAIVAERGGTTRVAGFGAKARDVTGGGDAATAGLIFGLLEGRSLAEAARFGQAAAFLTVSRAETVSPELSRARLLSLIEARTTAE